MAYLEVLGQNALACILAHTYFGVFYSSGFVLPTPNKLIRCFRFVILISQTMSSFCYTAQPKHVFIIFPGGRLALGFALVHETASALVHGDEIALVHADDKVELQRALPCSSTTGISRVSPFDGRITTTTSSSSCPNTSHAQIVKLASNTLLHRGW